MSEACLRQIRYWDKALKASQKGHKRKNRKIFSLEAKILELERTIRELMVEIGIHDETVREMEDLISTNVDPTGLSDREQEICQQCVDSLTNRDE